MDSDTQVSGSRFHELAKEYIGQKVAVIAARYQYRGILSKVCQDCIVLANACSVEVSGVTMSEHPQTEDVIGGSIIIKNDAIELFYQPKWCFAPLPGENEG